MSHHRRQSGLWERNPDGFFEQSESSVPSGGPYSYDQPPPTQQQQHEKRRTFSDRAIGEREQEPASPRSDVDKNNNNSNIINDKTNTMVTSANRPPLTIDPDYTPPSNLRSQAWSPDPEAMISPRQKQKKTRRVSNASRGSEGVGVGVVRRGSVPDRSPLQSLESWSKEEKRARAELAEGHLRGDIQNTRERDEKQRRNVQKPNQAKPYDRGPEPVRSSMDAAGGTGTYKRRTRDAGFAGAAEAAAGAPTIAAYEGEGAAERGKAAYERRKSQQAPPMDSPLQENVRRSGKTTVRPTEPLPTAEKVPVDDPSTHAGQHHRLGAIFHHTGHQHRRYQPSDKPREDWRRAKTGRLLLDDLDLEGAVRAAQKSSKPTEVASDAAWWEKDQRSRRASGGSTAKASPRTNPSIPPIDKPYEEHANGFQPRLFLKCGPLLRYTGMRREGVQGVEKETWRGSVMILTDDRHSDLSAAPVLRMFRQDMDLHQPPSTSLVEAGNVPPDAEDPVAGQVKLSRTGRALYVRPVHDISGEVDLSREENNTGLYSATRTSVLGPPGNPDTGVTRPTITFQDKSRIRARDGEKLGRYREVRATRLLSERHHTFWRFNIEVELASVQTRIAYRINKGPAVSFWVPARGETMNVLFHSCNGFSLSVDPHSFSGPDPLWRDVLNRHQAKPFHVMLGGGDQIYNDAVMRDTVLFKEWLATKNPETKRHADFTVEMQDELEEFYLERYAMWFSQGLFGMAGGMVPMVNVWDDHDIIDGFGSYPHYFQASPVFTGLGAIAHKYYMLFQHQSLPTETEQDEPSWLLGQTPGPYINQVSRNIFVSLGKKMALLGLDCRTERMRDEILSQETYDLIFDRCRREIIQGETKHLLVLLGVPIAYPRLNFLENILTSRVKDPIKALGRMGMLGGFVNKFDGGVEILDDLNDHWTARDHKAERNWFVQELQELAAEKSVRITILGGDVHLAAVGQFFTKKEWGIPKDRDHRYMPNVISSAIVNTPPPVVLADALNRRNKIHHLDGETDEDMIRIFGEDVDGSKRNNNCLLPRRNFCVLGEYVPGSTPPGTPGVEGSGDQGDEGWRGRDRRFPPGSMKRTMSLTRGPRALVRRLSGSRTRRSMGDNARASVDEGVGRPPQRFDGVQRANSLGSHPPDGYGFPPRHQPPPPTPPTTQMGRRPSYHRRPTDLSEKALRKAAARIGEEGNLDGRAPGEISLEFGLDVCLCVERDQKSARGETVGYRLLIPALWYEGVPDRNVARFSSHRKSLLERLRFNRKREASNGGVGEGEGEESEDGGDGGRASQDQDQDHDQQWATLQSHDRQVYAQQSSRDQQHPQPQVRQQLPPPPKQRSTNDPSHHGQTSPATALGLSSTGRGAITALPKRTTSGSAGYAAEPTVLPARSSSSTTPRAPRTSMDGYARPPPPSHDPAVHGDAYTKGFHGSGPPIGGGDGGGGAGYTTPIVARGPGAGAVVNAYPPSGYRRRSGPQEKLQDGAQYHVFPPQDVSNSRDGGGAGGGLPLSSVLREGEEDGESSLFSEESLGGGEGRGNNKAERFLGVRSGDGELGRERRKGWMIWK